MKVHTYLATLRTEWDAADQLVKAIESGRLKPRNHPVLPKAFIHSFDRGHRMFPKGCVNSVFQRAGVVEAGSYRYRPRDVVAAVEALKQARADLWDEIQEALAMVEVT